MFAELFTPEQLTILGQIILIDLVLAGDTQLLLEWLLQSFQLNNVKKLFFGE